MNPGELNQRIDILNLSSDSNFYIWDTTNTVWGKVEALDKTNIFSKVGIGVKSFKFVVRNRLLTLNQAFKWKDKFYFLTDIKEINRMYLEVTAAQIEPRLCIVTRKTIVKNKLNRPVTDSQTIITFPGCLIEKYMGYQQQTPQAVNEITYVLVTPKIINLEVGDLVKIGDDTYNVQVMHTLDEHKNEYEITIKKEA